MSAMFRLRRWAPAFLLSAAAFALPAHAVEIHGVQVAPTQQADGQNLVLNGAGTRYFLVFKVYVAALYLPHKAPSAQQVLDMHGPRELRLVMLRDVSGKELGDKLTDGIQNNVSPEDFGRLAPALARLGGLFAQKHQLKTGESVILQDTPGQGMRIVIDGMPAGAPYTEPGFFNALLKIWLGASPAEGRLKKALLGDTSVQN